MTMMHAPLIHVQQPVVVVTLQLIAQTAMLAQLILAIALLDVCTNLSIAKIHLLAQQSIVILPKDAL